MTPRTSLKPANEFLVPLYFVSCVIYENQRSVNDESTQVNLPDIFKIYVQPHNAHKAARTKLDLLLISLYVFVARV